MAYIILLYKLVGVSIDFCVLFVSGIQHVLKCTTEEDLKELTAQFTTELERFGSVVSVELIQGGSNKEVTLENREKYVESLAQYHMIGA